MNMHATHNTKTFLPNPCYLKSFPGPLSRIRTTLLTLGLLFLACTASLGTTYYVDAQNGNDNNTGLAGSFLGGNTGPWRTLSKVNDTFFAPGDSILLKRGAVWTDGPLEPQNGGAPGGTITIQETVLGQPLSFDLAAA